MDLSPDEVIALNRLTIVARVVAGSAHDVNNALQIVSGSVELLMRQTGPSDASRPMLQRIQAQAVRAASTLDELMQFARDGRSSSRRASLRDLVSKAAAMRGFALRRAGLVLDFNAQLAPPAFVQTRGQQLLQAVLNLIINAEQALREVEGGTIGLELAEASGHAVLRILDNGPGIDPSLEARAFEAFVTSHPVADASGLGLTAARLIAESHGGDLTLERLAQGMCATLRIPLAG